MKNLIVFANILIVLVTVSSIAMARSDRGTEVGNGGDVVVCESKQLVELLDIYEARTLRKIGFNFGGPENQTYQEKVRFAIRRLSEIDPYKASILWRFAFDFGREAIFLDDVVLKDVRDSNEIYLPAGCELRQIAVQNTRVSKNDPFYIFDNKLWKRLDENNKAALVLHELIFRAAARSWNSPRVRFYNSMVFGDFGLKRAAYYYVENDLLNDASLAFYDSNLQLWFFDILNIGENGYMNFVSKIPDPRLDSSEMKQAVKFCQELPGTFGGIIDETDFLAISDFTKAHLRMDGGELDVVARKKDQTLGVFRIHPYGFGNPYYEELPSETNPRGRVFCKSLKMPFYDEEV